MQSAEPQQQQQHSLNVSFLAADQGKFDNECLSKLQTEQKISQLAAKPIDLKIKDFQCINNIQREEDICPQNNVTDEIKSADQINNKILNQSFDYQMNDNSILS